jgi:hypothetical protein
MGPEDYPLVLVLSADGEPWAQATFACTSPQGRARIATLVMKAIAEVGHMLTKDVRVGYFPTDPTDPMGEEVMH